MLIESNAKTIPSRCKDLFGFADKMRREKSPIKQESHMRVGMHSVMTSKDDCFVHPFFYTDSEQNEQNLQCSLSGPYAASSRADRRSQIERILTAILPSNAAYEIIIDACREELTAFAAVEKR